MPTVKVAVVTTVPTIPQISQVSMLAISARTSARAGPELVGRDVVALLETVVDRLGDDLGLVAGAGGRRPRVLMKL